MTISIVNRTVFTTASNTPPQSFTIPATTAGNTMIVMGISSFGHTGAAPRLAGQLFSFPRGQSGASICFLLNIPGGITSLDYTVNVVPAVGVVYELTPCTEDGATYSPPSGQQNVTFGVSETGVGINSPPNAAYFNVIAQDGTASSVSSVNAPWQLDYTISALPTTGSGIGGVAFILNTSGLQTPVWTINNPNGTHGGVCGVNFVDSGPTPPPCLVKDGGGSTLSTYVSTLGLSIAPATELYTNFIVPANVQASQYTTEGRVAIVFDFNSGDGLYARDIETAFTWSLGNYIALRVWQPALIPMPEQQYNRPTDWDDGGTPENKFIQGVTVEADSFNAQKFFLLQSADDLSLHSLNEMPTTFPKQTIKSFSCLVPFVAHSARILATDGIAWRVWNSHIIFEPWPSQTMNWQTEQVSFGMTGWLHSREMNIAYASATAITVVLTFDAWPTITINLPSSGGAFTQAKTKVTLPANKFKLVAVRVFSTAPFFLFENDLEFKVKQWGSTEAYRVLKIVGGPSAPGAVV
jgi:hypothetical protein